MRFLPFLVLLLAVLPGCQSTGGSSDSTYTTVAPAAQASIDLARQDNEKAIKLIHGNQLDQAKRFLKQALTANRSFGPAHNNLGAVYLRQNHLYLAAWEFQYAIKLMPDNPSPENNLGMTLERGGKLDRAAKHYQAASKLAPDNLQIAGNLARAMRRRGDHGQQVRDLLQQIVKKDSRPAWVRWARQQLALLGQ